LVKSQERHGAAADDALEIAFGVPEANRHPAF
jgi:hypothetical protein